MDTPARRHVHAIYYPDILDERTAARTFSYGDKDVMLYALGIGLGLTRWTRRSWRSSMTRPEGGSDRRHRARGRGRRRSPARAGRRRRAARHRNSQINF